MTQTTASPSGSFYGVGVGPGDPELLTLKALKLIQQADVISYLVNEEGASHARHIAREAMNFGSRSRLEIPVAMPMNKNRSFANAVYDEAAESIARQLASGRSVVFLCEGDPLFYGSLAYLLERLQGRYPCQVVPGIASPQAAAARLQQPLALLTESFAVVSGRHSDDFLRQALTTHDNLVIMKVGRQRQRLLALLKETGRSDDARYLEYIGRDEERVISDMATLGTETGPGPYFSLFVVTRREHP